MDGETVDKEEGWTGNRDRQMKRDSHVDQDDPVVQEVPALLVDPEYDKRRNHCNSFANTHTHWCIQLIIQLFCCFFKHGPQVVQSIDKEEETKQEMRCVLCTGEATRSLIKLFLLKMYSNCKIRLQVRMTVWLTNCFWRTCFVATQPSGSGLTLIRLTGMVGCWASPLRFSVSQDKHTCKQTRALWNNLPQLLKQTANTMLDTVKHSLPHTDC